MSCRVFLADGHWLIRRGLRATLHQHDGCTVVGEAAYAPEAVAGAIEKAADLAILDVRLPDEGGIAAARMLKDRRRNLKVVLLSDQGGAGLVRDALRAGVDGYVRKDGSDHDLLEALRCVRAGKVYVDADMTRQLVLADLQSEREHEAGPLEQLTPRELEVFRLIGAGHTNRGAGSCLRLSPKTVEKYRAAVMRKLGLSSAVDLRLLALDLGVATRTAPAHAEPAGARA